MSISKGSQSDLISVIMDVQIELVSLIISEVTLKKGGEYFMVYGIFTSLVICPHLEKRGNNPPLAMAEQLQQELRQKISL